jgi:hypothetical protein
MAKQRYSTEFTDALFSGGAPIGPGITGLDQATIDAINLDNVRKAIARNINLDSQGDIRTFNVDDDLMDYNELMESDTTSSRGILDLFKDYIQGGGILGMATRGITNLVNTFGDAFKGSRFYNPISPVSGQRIFAPEARAGNPFGLQMRRDAASISRMLNRQAQGKAIGEDRLADIMGKFNLSGVDTDAMSDSIAQSAQTGYGGYGSAQAAASAAAAGGRDYSTSPGAMAGDMEYGEE